MLEQYNFKIEEELKDKLVKEQENLGVTKQEFLEQMYSAFEIEKLRSYNTGLNLYRFDKANDLAKDNIKKSFEFILSVIDNNFSTVEQQKLEVAEEKRQFKEKMEKAEKEFEEKEAEIDKKYKQLENEVEALKIEIFKKDKKIEELTSIADEKEQTAKLLQKMEALEKKL